MPLTSIQPAQRRGRSQLRALARYAPRPARHAAGLRRVATERVWPATLIRASESEHARSASAKAEIGYTLFSLGGDSSGDAKNVLGRDLSLLARERIAPSGPLIPSSIPSRTKAWSTDSICRGERPSVPALTEDSLRAANQS
jgi:hypothetical protein